MFGFDIGDCTTKHDHDEDLQEASEVPEQRPELRGGGDNLDHRRFHPRRRAAFEAMKHNLIPTMRAEAEACFDRVAALNPSWVHCTTTIYRCAELTPAAVAQNSNLNPNLTVVISLRRRIFHWLNLTTSNSTSGQRPWSSPHVHDEFEDTAQLVQLGGSINPKAPPASSKLGMSGLSLRGGADDLHGDSERRQDRRLGFLKYWRSVLSDQLLAGADATRPISIPGQVRYGPRFLEDRRGPRDEAYSMRAFTNFPDAGVDRRAAIESWLDTATLEEIDQRHTRPAISFENTGGPPAIVLQLTSIANDAQDSPCAIEVVEAKQESPVDQDEPIEKAESDRDSSYETLSTVPELDSNEYDPSEEVLDTVSQYSDTLCPSIASEGSTLVDDWIPRPTFVTTARPVDFPREDIWDEYAC